MRPRISLDSLMKRHQESNRAPGDGTHISERISITIQDKPADSKTKTEKEEVKQ